MVPLVKSVNDAVISNTVNNNPVLQPLPSTPGRDTYMATNENDAERHATPRCMLNVAVRLPVSSGRTVLQHNPTLLKL